MCNQPEVCLVGILLAAKNKGNYDIISFQKLQFGYKLDVKMAEIGVGISLFSQ